MVSSETYMSKKISSNISRLTYYAKNIKWVNIRPATRNNYLIAQQHHTKTIITFVFCITSHRTTKPPKVQ